MSIFLLVLSLVFLMFLCMRGVPIFVAAFLAGVFLLLTAGMNPIDPFITSYSDGLGGYFGKFFFIFILGAIFGKLTDTSGAADSIAKAIIDRFGERFIIPSIVVACAILAYGGVSVFVALFTVYPMMVSLFRKANLPRRLLPVTYFAGAGTFVCMMPGSPQIQNLIPMKFLDTPADAAFVPGMLTAGVEAALVFAFMIWLVKRVRANGEHFVASKKDAAVLASLDENRKMPHWSVALLPMIVLLVALNAFKLEAGLAIFVGIIAALIFYANTLNWKNIWKNLGGGTMDGVTALFNTSAVVGFGYLVQLTPAFREVIDLITDMGGNPLISAGIAVTSLAGVCGSGSGALGITMPILAEYYLPLGVDPEALHRVSTLACLGLDSLPHNGLVVTVLTLCGVSHKDGYGPVGVVTVLIPLICLVVLIALLSIF